MPPRDTTWNDRRGPGARVCRLVAGEHAGLVGLLRPDGTGLLRHEEAARRSGSHPTSTASQADGPDGCGDYPQAVPARQRCRAPTAVFSSRHSRGLGRPDSAVPAGPAGWPTPGTAAPAPACSPHRVRRKSAGCPYPTIESQSLHSPINAGRGPDASDSGRPAAHSSIMSGMTRSHNASDDAWNPQAYGISQVLCAM